MRTLYRPVWEGIHSSLRDIFREGFPAGQVITRHLKTNRKWGSHDRKLFAEAVYDLVRWWRKLLYVSEVAWPEEDRWVYADLEIFSRVIESWCIIHEVLIDPAVNKSGVHPKAILSMWRDLSVSRAVRESIPDWLDRFGEEQLGEVWNEILPALNGPAPVFLRVNRLKASVDDLVQTLRIDKVDAEAVGDDCIRLARRSNVFLAKSFAAGHFEVQDRNSQRVAPALLVEPGQRVIDACAGAGGKTLHLAALMGNKGKIIAMDVAENKLEQLRERANRAGATSIEARLIDSTKVIKRLKDSADRVLLDVPCSGLGVLRRNPDSKWKLSRPEVDKLIAMQSEILRSYSQMVKPGGIMVYATCSIMPCENQQQVAKFLAQNEANWTLDYEENLLPEDGGGDGFYLARLKKS